jgi:predicted XRE-type DNA-binding protein
MARISPVVTRNADDLAGALRLSRSDAVQMQLRRIINDKIIEAVKRARLTHAQAARVARTSRTRLTAILNRNTANVSTDLMLRVLAALGYQAKITFKRTPRAA